MALYQLEEFAAFFQSDVNTATALLLRDLVSSMVEDISGVVLEDVTVPATVKAIALTAAARAYANPKGYTSVTIDDYTYRREGEAAALGLYLSETEREDVAAAFTPADTSRNAFSISPVFDAPWVRTGIYPTWPIVQ